MLVASVPAADDEDEAGADGAFEKTLEGAEDHEMGPVLRGADAGYADTWVREKKGWVSLGFLFFSFRCCCQRSNVRVVFSFFQSK